MRKLKTNIYFQYSIIFLVILVIGLLPIEIKNKTFLFSGLFVDKENYDGLTQHILFMNDFISQIKSFLFSNGPFPIYRFDIGLGADFFTSYTYYSLFDPLLIIAYIIPLKYIELSYYLIIMARLYLSGLFMIILAKHLGFKNKESLLGIAIVYCFSNVVTYSAFRHPMFTNGPMLLPLIILGTIRIFQNKRPYLLIFSAFYALLVQFYIFVYLCFGFELFVIIKTIMSKDDNKIKIKKFFKVNFTYLLGALLASFILLPQINAILFGGRISSKGFIWYPLEEYILQLITYLIPLTAPRYTISIGNFFIFFICLLHLSSKERKWYSYYLIVLCVLLALPFFGYVINGFSYINNRWTFLIALPCSLMLGDVLEGKININDETYHHALKLFISFVVVDVSLGLIYGFSLLKLFWLIKYVVYIILLALTIYVIKIINQIKFSNVNFQWFNSKNIFKVALLTSLLSLLSIAIYYTQYLTPAYSFQKYYSNPATYNILKEENNFYRVEMTSFEANMNYFANDTIFYRLPSTSEYNTMTNGYINNFFKELEIVNSNNSVGYNGFDGRARLLVLNNVKYYIVRESKPTPIPYGFEYYTSIDVKKYDQNKKVFHPNTNIEKVKNQIVYEKADVYVNKNFVSFGNLFTQTISINDFNKLHPLQKELLLLDTIVLNEELHFPTVNHIPEIICHPVENLILENIELNDNQIIVHKNKGILRFTINNVHNSEVFIEITGLHSPDKFKTYEVYYRTYQTNKREKNYAYGRNMYTDNSTHLVNLGYFAYENLLTVEIEFDKGIYNFNSIGYYLIDVSDIESKAKNLSNNSLANLKLLDNGFTGQINSANEGLLFVSLPYSKGFKAFINGNQTKIYQANIGYMAIIVPAGTSIIEFKYMTPGLNFGLILSIISLISVIILLVFYELINYRRLKVGKYNEGNS